MKSAYKIGEVLNFFSRAKLVLFKSVWRIMVLWLLVFGNGCSTTREIILGYQPLNKAALLEEAGNISIKVITNDLRKEKSLGIESTANAFSLTTINSKIELNDIVTQAIEAELIRRGFKVGRKVLIEVDLIKLHSYVVPTPFLKGWKIVAEIVFHVNVKTTNTDRLFQKFIRQREESSPSWSGREENAIIALNATLKSGITNLVSDPDFIKSLIKASSL